MVTTTEVNPVIEAESTNDFSFPDEKENSALPCWSVSVISFLQVVQQSKNKITDGTISFFMVVGFI
jgi:hypothetical protein